MMLEILIHKLYAYTKENNPELLLELQEQNSVTDWLMQKVEAIDMNLRELMSKNTPGYEIEEQSMALMTSELKPSKYQFIKNILEEDFTTDFETLEKSERLVTTIIELMPCCEDAFQRFGFYEGTEDDRLMRYAITGVLHECLHQ